MATFPDLIPSTRTYICGEYPHTPHLTYSGSQVRVRHSNAVLGMRLRMFFPALTSTEMLEIQAHYAGQRGGFVSFIIPDELLSGTDEPEDFTLAGYRWLYASRPQVVDIAVDGDTPSNFHDVTVELVSTPEKPVVHVPRVVYRLQALAPEVIGTPSSVDVPLVSYSLTPLAPTVEAVGGGGGSAAPLGELIHLPFTDDALDYGPRNLIPAAVGGASFVGSGGKWSTGYASFDGTDDYYEIVQTPDYSRISAGEILTLEGFFYMTALPSSGWYGCVAWSGHIYFGIHNSGGTGYVVAFISANGGGSFPLALTSSTNPVALNEWNYFQVYRDPADPSRFTISLNGVTVSTGTHSGVGGVLAGGNRFTVGAYPDAIQAFAGRANSIRMSASEAIPATIPPAAFPTSRPTPDPIDVLDLSPVAWWDASDASSITLDGGKVSQWDDKSGYGWHLSQATSTQRPSVTTAAVNGLDAVTWPTTGNDYHLTTAAGTFTAAEFYAVVEFDGNGAFPNFNGLIVINGAGPFWVLGGFSGLYDNGVSAYINANSLTNRTTNLFPEIDSPCLVRFRLASGGDFTTSNGVMVGSEVNVNLNRGWEKYICELVAVPVVLSIADRYVLEYSLMNKWGI